MHDSVSSSGTPRAMPFLMTSDLCNVASGAAMSIGAADPSDRASPIVFEERGRRIRKRIAGQRTEQDRPDLVARHVDRGLRQQDDVAAIEVDVLVRRIEGGRLTPDCPMRGRKDIPHVEPEADERLHPTGKRRRRQQPIEHAPFLVLPGEADADIDRHDSLSLLKRQRRTSTALSSPPEQSTAI